jgi:peptidoglycan/LPS O-acetylase OafA/YrhL
MSVSESREHFIVLDGLRGVASIIVVIFHLFEAHSMGDAFGQTINHGYLAVDFFFLLSGFVIAYAYDDRWQRMGVGEFFKRRLIRLQPMVVVGGVIGALMWYAQDYSLFPKVASASVWQVIGAMLLACFMIPLPTSLEIRGWTEMYPLNGPAWSLFYEYVANILYALFMRKLSNAVLGIFVFLAAAGLVALLVLGERGSVIGGWALDGPEALIGVTRLMFPFFAGVLLMRLGKRIPVQGAFLVSSLLLVAVLSVPRIGGKDTVWMNGLYEAFCVIVVFPVIVAIGAHDKGAGPVARRIAAFFGALSFPLYITHYPLMYIYTGWVIDEKVSAMQGVVAGTAVLVVSVLIAWMALKYIDEPVRRWLSARYLTRSRAR